MIKVIKQAYDALRGSVRGFLTKVRVTIHSGVESLKTALNKLRFPVWYFILLHIAAFVTVTEITQPWILWATLMTGFIAWAFKQTNQ
jgi:hypothetical protein